MAINVCDRCGCTFQECECEVIGFGTNVRTENNPAVMVGHVKALEDRVAKLEDALASVSIALVSFTMKK